MRQAIAVALLLTVAVVCEAARWWVPLIPIALRLVWDAWGFIRTQVVPLLKDD